MKVRKTKQQGFLSLGIKVHYLDIAVHYALRLFAASFNLRPAYRSYLRGEEGWINFSVGMRTESHTMAQTLIFDRGKVLVKGGVSQVDTLLIYKEDQIVKAMISMTPNEVMLALLEGKMRIEGNMSIMSLFNFYLSLVLVKPQKKKMATQKQQSLQEASSVANELTIQPSPNAEPNRKERLKGMRCDQVVYLDDPFLGDYSLDDFPRIQQQLRRHFDQKPEVCIERPALLTRWYKQNGFETKANGSVWNPVLRQAGAFKYLMSSKMPAIGTNSLLGGTTTTKETGVVLYPDAHATLLWGELLLLSDRTLNPYNIDPKEREQLHRNILPFWLHRNFREWVREHYDAPLCQKLDERFAVYFSWKTVAFSHTVLDYPKLLKLGISGVMDEIQTQKSRLSSEQQAQRDTLDAMLTCLEGLAIYSKNIAHHALQQANREPDTQRKQELQHIADMCHRIAAQPPTTLDEALQLIWIGWIALHMENTNAGLSFGRMDQWLQPYFASDMDKLDSEQDKQSYIRHSIEMLSSFYMRCTDHLPTIPDIGNYLFGGSSSTQAITLGGVTPEGKSAVNDMTFLFLKVTEMLKLRDPNINTRYHHEKNSSTYLQRLCEVNLITCATPSIHSDEGVMRSLQNKGYSEQDIRDWSVVGCVEPTLSGKHMGHTGSTMFNMVAALEMAMNQGKHPLMDWAVGPVTKNIKTGEFCSFELFFDAFTQQLAFLVDHAVEYNNQLGEAHSILRPTPLLSSLMDGCIDKGQDATMGGARYNTSGIACIGLSDVIDSLMTIKQLVFDEQSVSFAELQAAIDNNFEGYQRLHTHIMKKVPKFGSGNVDALALGNRVTGLVHGLFAGKNNFRGGAYTTGFWSMSNHVAFGNLTGALPSGRKARKAFTPGLTPSPQASKNLLDNIRDVGELNPEYMDNNVAFNVKYVPSGEDSHWQSVNNMASYVKAYAELGGMQMQMNVVSSEVLKEAMIYPENYRDLLVRISGYNAYFVTLNREMQIELIERAQYNA